MHKAKVPTVSFYVQHVLAPFTTFPRAQPFNNQLSLSKGQFLLTAIVRK